MSGYFPAKLDSSKPEGVCGPRTDPLRSPPVHVPLNLTEWFPEEKILSWVEQEIERLPRELLSPSSAPGAKVDERWRRLAVLMTFAYSVQVFRSGEIATACHTNSTLKSICANKAPFAQELEHFRRANRPVLEAALAGLLMRVMIAKLGAHPGTMPPAVHEQAFARAEELLDTARHLNTWDESDA